VEREPPGGDMDVRSEPLESGPALGGPPSQFGTEFAEPEPGPPGGKQDGHAREPLPIEKFAKVCCYATAR
jgi:hypothetical protein